MMFNEYEFSRRLDKSMERVRQILATNKFPKYAKDIHHHYDDKFNLAHFLTNMVCLYAPVFNFHSFY